MTPAPAGNEAVAARRPGANPARMPSSSPTDEVAP
jgi:hypothetical protein